MPDHVCETAAVEEVLGKMDCLAAEAQKLKGIANAGQSDSKGRRIVQSSK